MVSWKYGLKGATVFRDKCKKAGILSDGGQILNYNPAPFPWITVDEKWTNKKTGEVREFSNHIQITDEKYKAEQIDVERCPLCGGALVKQGGCTKCSNPECVYEKCAI
jgi:ribonucleoside-diphosphate reductase alpha chain